MPPSRYTIPKSDRIGFERLTNLSDESFDAVNNILSNYAKSGKLPSHLAHEIAASDKISNDDAQLLITILIKLFSLYQDSNLTLKEFVDDINIAVDEALSKSEEYSSNSTILNNRLNKLLSHNATLGVAAKITDVTSDHSNIFWGARLLTDIRPIFVPFSADEIATNTVIHTLKLQYICDGKISSIYVALDNKDLAKIQKQITRAQEKEATIKKSLLNPNNYTDISDTE